MEFYKIWEHTKLPSSLSSLKTLFYTFDWVEIISIFLSSKFVQPNFPYSPMFNEVARITSRSRRKGSSCWAWAPAGYIWAAHTRPEVNGLSPVVLGYAARWREWSECPHCWLAWEARPNSRRLMMSLTGWSFWLPVFLLLIFFFSF